MAVREHTSKLQMRIYTYIYICIYTCMYAEGVVAWLSVASVFSQDRNLVLKGSKAFVSFVRAYKEHLLSFLLPFSVRADSFSLSRFFAVKNSADR